MRRSACVIISCLSGLPAVWSRKVHNTCYQNRHLASYSVLYTRFEDFKPCSYVSFIAIMGLHTNARCEVYPRADVKRFRFLMISQIKFNCVDESSKVDRRCFKNGQPHNYEIDENGFPINPSGRTGLKGRGSLGRWGPNHAADPIVTRWKRDSKGNIVQKDGKNVLQFVAVKRTDGGGWALPGGMVNPGENKTATLIREFGEEALNSLEKSEKQTEEMKKCMAEFFQDGETIYKGYVDDPRNTDNAWMETKAMNFHDSNGQSVGKFSLHAGDDAAEVQWMDIDHSLKLYASHIDFIKTTVGRRNAHW